MDFSFYLHHNKPNEQKLLAFGFVKTSGKFLLNKPINDDFLAKISLDGDNFTINLVDNSFNGEYEMLNIESINTGFVLSLRAKVEALAKEIVENCFENINVTAFVVKHIKQTYAVDHQSPWKEYPHYLTFKHPETQKWFAIIMDVGMDKIVKGKNYVANIMNLKAEPEFIKNIIDNKNIFPAYHMNKQHWYTVLLDKNISADRLKLLIDKSYNSVAPKSKKQH